MKIDLNKIHDKKIVGAGVFGTAYLININSIKYIVKRQKVLELAIHKTFKSKHWRELDFYECIERLPKHKKIFFVECFGYEFYDNCDHIQNGPFKINNEYFKKLKKSKWCLETILEYKGNSLGQYLLSNTFSKNQLYSLMLQIYVATDIMHSNGYLHNDIHSGNITVQHTTDKYLVYNKLKIPTYGYVLSLIDYGEVLNNKYKHHYNFYKNNSSYVYFIETFWAVNSIINPIDKYIKKCKNSNKKLPWETIKFAFLKLIIKIYSNHSQFWNEKKDIICTTHPKSKKYFDSFEKTHDFSFKKDKNMMIGFTAFELMSTYFAASYPKKYGEYYGWCSHHKYLLPLNELEDMMELNSKAKILKYLMNALKVSI